jgi:hypothetical protein
MRLTFTVEHSHVDGERTYTSTVELSDKASIEAIEAHARTMIKILADQATKDCESDDEDEDDWKKVNT